MALSERLAYILDFNVASGIRSLEQVGKTADRELGKAEQKLDKIQGNLTKFGTGALAFAGVTGTALFKMGQGAAEAQANLAALEQVVGDVAAQDVRQWAENSATGVGLASKEAVAAATQFAGLGKIIGLSNEPLARFAQQHVELAADMAAFKDVSPQQAIEDLQSAYAGSTEVLRKYNIFLDDQSLKQAYARETGEQVTGTLTTQQKILAINSELYRQGADMLGQWGRESGELAGQQATLSANLTNLSDKIGAGVLPMLTDVVGAAASTAGALASVDEATGGAVGRFAALGAAGVGLIGTLSLVAGQAIKMRDRFTTLERDGTRSLNNVGRAARGVGLALGAAGVALAAYSANQAKAEGDVRDLADAFAQTATQSDEMAASAVPALVKFGKATGDLKPALDLFVKGNIEAARRLVETGAAAEGGAEFVDMLTEAIKAEEQARANAAKVIEEHGDALTDTTEATNEATAATNRSADAVRLQDQLVKDVNRTLAEQEQRLAESAERTERFRQRAEELGTQWDILKGKMSDRAAFLDVQDSFDRVHTAAQDAWTAAAEGAEDAEQKARNYERAQIDLKNKVIDYSTEVRKLPDQVLTNILSLIDQGKLAEAEQILARLERSRQINYIPVVQPPRTPGGNSYSHTGTRVGPGEHRQILAGESFVPDVPGRIDSREDTRRAMQGGRSAASGPLVSIGELHVGSRQDRDAVVEALGEAVWRAQFMVGRG